MMVGKWVFRVVRLDEMVPRGGGTNTNRWELSKVETLDMWCKVLMLRATCDVCATCASFC